MIASQFLSACLVGLQLTAAAAPRDQVETLDGEPTQIAVLATAHLSGVEGLDESWTAPLIDRLADWQPDMILVERLPAYQIEMMLDDPAYAGVAEQFAGETIQLAAASREALGLTRREAEDAAAALLAGGSPAAPADRRHLAALFLAAYDLDSAALQWAYLPADARHAGDGVTETAADALDRELESRNETRLLATALAARLDLQQVAGFDSHADKDDFLAAVPAITEAMSASTVMTEMLAGSTLADHTAAGTPDPEAGNALDFYRRINGSEFLTRDVQLQWASFARADMNGLGRQRLAYWESRNLTMAAHVRQTAAACVGCRVLVIVGGAHKPFLDDLLARSMDVDVIDIRAVLDAD